MHLIVLAAGLACCAQTEPTNPLREEQEPTEPSAGSEESVTGEAGSYAGQGAQPRFRHVTIEDGLSQNDLHALAQDRQGFVWIGTKDGLNRYDGVLNKEGAALAVVIAPPWWRTWWAYPSYLLLAFGFASTAYRYRRNRLRLQRSLEIEHLESKSLRELDQAKSLFFANVSNEFRTPLTLTLGPLDDVLGGEYGEGEEDVRGQLSLARRSAGRVLGLIN